MGNTISDRSRVAASDPSEGVISSAKTALPPIRCSTSSSSTATTARRSKRRSRGPRSH